MTKAPVLTRAAISALLTAAPIGLSACATAHEAPTSVEALLLNPQDPATRQAIRVFVREKSGAGVITNPDSLTQSPVLVNNRRRADIGIGRRDARQSFTPTGDYRLVMDENNRCWLIHRLQDTVSHVELPASASCTAYAP